MTQAATAAAPTSRIRESIIRLFYARAVPILPTTTATAGPRAVATARREQPREGCAPGAPGGPGLVPPRRDEHQECRASTPRRCQTPRGAARPAHDRYPGV